MAAIDRPAVRLGCAAAALALFCAAYAFPAIGTCSRDPARMINWFDNSTVLFFGWLGIFNLQLGWFANIALGAHLLALVRGAPPGRRPIGIYAALLAVGLASLQPALGMTLWHNEAWSEPICRLGAGVWLWAAAHLLVLAAVIRLRRSAGPSRGARE